jgi:putative sterol carrier protein
VPAGYAVNPNFAVVLPMMCHDDEATAIERGIDGAHFFGYSLAHYYVFGEHHPGRTNIWEEFQRNRDERGFARDIIVPEQGPLGVKIFQEGFGSLRGAIGTPEQVRDLCRRYEEAGVDQVIFVSQAGRNQHEHICESLELFAKEVMPEFAGRAEAHESAKAQRLAGEVDDALRRRDPPRIADPAYTIPPMGSGPPPPPAGGDGRPNGRAPAIARRLQKRGEAAFTRFVHRASDRRLERTVGSDPGLRVVFKEMARRFRPDKAAGFSGDIQYELAPAVGEAKPWVVSVNGARASARPGRAPAPAVTIAMELADFARLVGRDLDPGKALLEGKLTVEGDFNVLTKLGEMFGEPAP